MNVGNLYIQKAFSRHLVRFPWQLALAIIGISVGVAVVVAIQLVRVSAYDSFARASLQNAGYFSHRIQPNGTQVIPYSFYQELKAQFPFTPISPVVDFNAVTAIAGKKEPIYVLGFDPIARATLPGSIQAQPEIDVENFLSKQNFVVMSRRTANDFQVARGDTLSISINGQTHELFVGALLPNQDERGGIANSTLLIDVATAQELLGISTAFTRIDINLTDDEPIVVNKLVPDTYSLINNHDEIDHLKNMTNAFYVNLTALSLMALMMGMFLIYNTETFLVLQRQQIISRLKAIGISDRAILQATLLEAIFLGAIGSALGLLLGVVLANGLLKIVSVTLNDLYFENTASDVLLEPTQMIAAVLLGIAMTLIAAAIPANIAAKSPLINNLHRTSNSSARSPIKEKRYALLAVSFFAVAVTVISVSGSVVGGFTAIACVLCGFACLCVPALTMLTKTRATQVKPFENLVFERIGLRTIGQSLQRTAPAAAALMIATAAGIGISVMVASFRVSVADWLGDSLRADFYLSPSFSLIHDAAGISPHALNRVSAMPGIEMVSSVTRERVLIEKTSEPQKLLTMTARLSAFELNVEAKKSFRFIEQLPNLWSLWRDQDVTIITEPFANHQGYALGELIRVRTPKGEINLKVIGIYKDYASEQGSISINRAIFEKYWSNKNYSGVGLYTNGELSTAQIQHYLDHDATLANLSAVSSNEIFRQSMQVFDRTFLITNLLKIITVAVAFIGIVGALLAQQLERSHEYAVYRAMGFNRVEILRLLLTQTFVIGITSIIVAVPAGLLVAKILIDVINPRSFGWTMAYTVPISSLLTSIFVALFAALCAGLIPAFRIAKISPAAASRFE